MSCSCKNIIITIYIKKYKLSNKTEYLENYFFINFFFYIKSEFLLFITKTLISKEKDKLLFILKFYF
jgi:hypothetical protein